MPSLFTVPIHALKQIGPKRAQLFEQLGLSTVGQLLRYYPRTYRNWQTVRDIRDVPPDETAVIRVTVTRPPAERRIRKGMILYKFSAADETGSVEVTLFNNKFGAARFTAGSEFLLYGKLNGSGLYRTMSAPDFAEAGNGGQIQPIYGQTEGLPSRIIQQAAAQALTMLPEQVRDPLPDELRTRRGLCGLREAICTLHQPPDMDRLAEAHRRAAYEELLVMQLGLLRHKSHSRGETALRLTHDDSEAFFARLPFAPTGAQRRAVSDAIRDMMRSTPMARLLQGDVGSGKTAVAAALCHTAARNGLQSALMAPTEILAAQHASTLQKLFDGTGIVCALLTGSTPAARKREILAGLADGSVHVVAGTHALISDAVVFQRLGLIITDEQHRFGVAQRAALSAKGAQPHLLVMSATPIPRTLALMMYGDLDLSVLDELPPGRLPVDTLAIRSSRRERAFAFIRSQLELGRQAYVVCSLVEGDDEAPDDRKAAADYCTELQHGALAGFTVDLLHGRMKAAEKEAAMAKFAAGETQVLVATTVIEVGVDVPNASVMLIENAERFGLSQLHQLRGRVGRGGTQSYCILVSDAQGAEARKRLSVMVETTDGFRIADEDLQLRGPGDFFGTRQHGLPALQMAGQYSDIALMQMAQEDALSILHTDPGLDAPQHRALATEVRRLFGSFGGTLN
ncbi:MAG: ATP-dependent DNA helicase RecG [Clostridia bacterium]|nr:ATP-dependent DNA helicase RecG [Clostridia bacterium]